MRDKFLLLAGIVGAVIAGSPANAAVRISGDPGGLLTAYADRFAAARASGERVIIDGACLSACTLAVAMLPRGQVCATRNAVLGFHAAWKPTANGGMVESAVATQAMYELYPPDVRKWIVGRGGLSGKMIFLRGRELAEIVPSCDAGMAATARTGWRGRSSARALKRDLPMHGTLAAQSLR